jgi:SSS family solute:Na+ symporter
MWLGMGAGVAGEIGLVTIVSICEQGYMRAFGFVLLSLISSLILLPIFGIFGFGIERFRATQAMSVPQYIEMRYSKRLRILTGYFNNLSGILQMAIFPIVGANFIKVLINAPEHVSLIGLHFPTTWLIMAILLGCAILFTNFGGYVTLVVTNFFQMIIIVGSLYWLFFVLVADLGVQNFWTKIELYKGLNGVYSFGEGSEYGIFYFLWLTIMSILLQFSYGPYLQKYASMDKPKTARRSYLIGMIFGQGRTYIIIGIGAAALAALGPDAPSSINVAPYIWNSMATPYYLSHVVPPILMGIFLTGLLFADVSTTDQYVLSWSTSIVNDCICPLKKTPFSTTTHIRAVKLTTIVICFFLFLFGIIYKPTMPIWEYLWLCANIIGGSGIAVLAGMYWKRATTAGAYAAILLSLFLPIADMIARRIFLAINPEGIFPWEPKYTGFSTYVVAAIAMIGISLMSQKKTKYWDLGQTVRDLNKAK